MSALPALASHEPPEQTENAMNRPEWLCAEYGHEWQQTDWCVVRGSFWNSGMNLRACTRCGVLSLPEKKPT